MSVCVVVVVVVVLLLFWGLFLSGLRKQLILSAHAVVNGLDLNSLKLARIGKRQWPPHKNMFAYICIVARKSDATSRKRLTEKRKRVLEHCAHNLGPEWQFP